MAGRLQSLTKQLTIRFGALSEAQQTQLENASDEELDKFIERVVTVDSIEAVLGR